MEKRDKQLSQEIHSSVQIFQATLTNGPTQIHSRNIEPVDMKSILPFPPRRIIPRRQRKRREARETEEIRSGKLDFSKSPAVPSVT